MGERKRGIRMRCCSSCGKQEEVRADNQSTVCRSCSARKNGANGVDTIKARGRVSLVCSCCGVSFTRRKFVADARASKAVFCSLACRKQHYKVERSCAECGSLFHVARSTAEQSAARFCTRACYKRFLCRTDHDPQRGHRWKAVRRKAIEAGGFCAICGTRHSLQVHHIAPYRLSRDNTQENLICLCPKHHKQVEFLTVECEAAGASAADMKVVLGSVLRERQLATLMVLKGMKNGS